MICETQLMRYAVNVITLFYICFCCSSVTFGECVGVGVGVATDSGDNDSGSDSGILLHLITKHHQNFITVISPPFIFLPSLFFY